MRLALRQKVEAGMLAANDASNSRKDWSHITEQIGMFCYTGLSLEQVDSRRCCYLSIGISLPMYITMEFYECTCHRCFDCAVSSIYIARMTVASRWQESTRTTSTTSPTLWCPLVRLLLINLER